VIKKLLREKLKRTVTYLETEGTKVKYKDVLTDEDIWVEFSDLIVYA